MADLQGRIEPVGVVPIQVTLETSGPRGEDGVGIASISIENDKKLHVQLTNGTSYTSPTTLQGNDGVGISNVQFNADDTLTISLSNGQSYKTASLRGPAGTTITNLALVSGNHAPGTQDTYRITLSDRSTFDFKVYNGANGNGAGDMLARNYDPRGIGTDVYAYADQLVSEVYEGAVSQATTAANNTVSAYTYSKSDIDTKVASAGKVKTVNGQSPDADGNIAITIPDPDLDSIVEYSATQPTDPDNQIWVVGNVETVEIPTMEDLTQYSKIKQAFGSYVGTGEYGPAHQNVLHFDFTPNLVIVTVQRKGGGLHYGAVFIKGQRIYSGIGAVNESIGYVYLDTIWSENQMSWYSRDDTLATDSLRVEAQLNLSGFTYYYVAFGE